MTDILGHREHRQRFVLGQYSFVESLGRFWHTDRHCWIHRVVASFLGEAEKGFDGGDHTLSAGIGHILSKPHIERHHIVSNALAEGTAYNLGEQGQIRLVGSERMLASESAKPPANESLVITRPSQSDR